MPDRLPCQGCGRLLTTRPDGLVKPHNTRRHNGYRCRAAGFRHARWPVGQQLLHHAGSVWEIVEDAGGPWGDYRMKLVSNPPGDWRTPEGEPGLVRTFHGEYMHRDGWRQFDAVAIAA